MHFTNLSKFKSKMYIIFNIEVSHPLVRIFLAKFLHVKCSSTRSFGLNKQMHQIERSSSTFKANHILKLTSPSCTPLGIYDPQLSPSHFGTSDTAPSV